MSPSQLKNLHLLHFPTSTIFNRANLRFTGDSMSNYAVRNYAIGSGVECWELYRKKPVKNGQTASKYFDKTTYKQLFLNN
jgi:hypothetical protein